MGDLSEYREPLKRHLFQYGRRPRTDGPYADNLDVDVLVIGAGFSGIYMLHELRKQGFKTVLYDAGTGFGGTWRFNCYPGARVDTEAQIYQLSIPEVWKTWTWSTNYPDWRELQAYFDHVDKVLDLSKESAFQTVVISSEFDTDEGKWTVKTADGRTAKTRFLIVATGFAAKRYIPHFKGIDNYKGTIHHSSFWPNEDVDVRGKRTVVIGTGASGIQICQEWGAVADNMTVFQRTPNLALPMGRRILSKEEQELTKRWYPELFAYRERCWAGHLFQFVEKGPFDVSEEEREAILEEVWNKGGFSYLLGNFRDLFYDEAANKPVYDFWAKKQRARITDPKKRDLLCPLKPPHPFGVKRPCLEQNLYEVLDRDSVEIIDISTKNGNTIEEFTEKGLRTTDGREFEFDVIALATGFDIITGGMTSMGLKSIHGNLLEDEWKKGANTYLGTTVSGFPNMFHIYGPHAPSMISNGPSSIEVQGRWIRDAIEVIDRQGWKYVDPTPEASAEWKKHINELSEGTLFTKSKTTMMGGDIPGKVFETVTYVGGVGAYHDELRAVLPSLKGFTTVMAG